MDKEEIKELKKLFGCYKAEYSNRTTTNERKNTLVSLMKENLKKRNKKNCDTIVCLDRKERSLASTNVEDLYAIDGALNAADSSERLTVIADDIRNEANRNLFESANTYPE